MEPAPFPTTADLVVVGGGVIGLACAWRSAERGLSVVVVDPDPGRGAAWVAAGMLAPVSEVHYGEEALLALNLRAAGGWARFAAQLETASGCEVHYDPAPTLLVAADDDDAAWLGELAAFQGELGLDAQRLSVRRARALEPSLAPGIRAALLSPGDHRVDNRRLMRALRRAAQSVGVRLLETSVAALTRAGGAVRGVILEGGAELRAQRVVVAAGWRSGSIGAMALEDRVPLRAVKGQILRLRPNPVRSARSGAVPTTTVRGIVAGQSVYVVPRVDGEVVVGATVEEQGGDRSVTAGAVHALLRDAQRVVPAVRDLEFSEAAAGLRPATPDNAPAVGAGTISGLVIATGHFRNGVLLAPLTAEAVATLVTGGAPDPIWDAFGPGRFLPHDDLEPIEGPPPDTRRSAGVRGGMLEA